MLDDFAPSYKLANCMVPDLSGLSSVYFPFHARWSKMKKCVQFIKTLYNDLSGTKLYQFF